MAIQITRRGIRRGANIFTVISLLSLVGIFLFTRSHMTVEAFQGIDPVWLLAAVPLIAIDWIGSGYRIYIFGRVFYPRVRFKTCVKANLANYFLGAVTPAQMGGGPAQIYMLHAGGMSAVAATSSSVMSFVSTTLFLIVAAAATFVSKEAVPLPGSMLRGLFAVGILFFLAVAALTVIAIVSPGFYRELMRLIVRALSRVRGKDYLREGSWGGGMVAAVDRCHRQILFFLFRRTRVFVQAVIVTAAVFLSKFALAYCIVRALGAQASFLHVSLLQMAIILINYYFPTPGASGAAELSSAALMAPIVTRGLVAPYVILWRLLGMYLPVAVGGAAMLHEFGKRDRIEVETDEDAPPGTREECGENGPEGTPEPLEAGKAPGPPGAAGGA